MILLDGKKLAYKILEELKQEIAGTKKQLRLAVVVVPRSLKATGIPAAQSGLGMGENPAVKKFIEQKKKTAASIGINVRIYPFEEKVTTNELRKRVAEIVHEKKNTGVIIQLPLPSHINTQYILNSVTPEKDVDVLSARSIGNFVVGKSLILPPVVGAVKAFFDEYQIDYKSKYTVVVGAGNLVGGPLAFWLLSEKVTFSVLRSATKNPEEFLRKADIIISGVGRPKFITGDMVKKGVVVIDAGTSESEGKLVGDVDFDSVSKKASYLTPVLGGVGPLTIAMLLRNLLILSARS